jgi:hypothetical protein
MDYIAMDTNNMEHGRSIIISHMANKQTEFIIEELAAQHIFQILKREGKF